jgi:F0F1-type ATP synthase membrane subunit a
LDCILFFRERGILFLEQKHCKTVVKKMIRNPLEQFEILDLLSISILDIIKISLTNVGLYILIGTSLLLIITIWNNQKTLLVNKNSLIQESTYDTILSIIKDQIGEENERYLPFIFSLFLFILFSNLIGLVPYSFTATSQIKKRFRPGETLVV